MYRKSNNLIPCRFKSAKWQQTGCNMLKPFKSIRRAASVSKFPYWWNLQLFPSGMIFCFSVLGHDVAWCLQLDACVLLNSFIIFLFEANTVSLPQQLCLSRFGACIQLERKHGSVQVFIGEICINSQIYICHKLRSVLPVTFVLLTVTWTLIDHFSLNKSFAVNIAETQLFICYTGLRLT